MDFTIIPLNEDILEQVRLFTDKWIGTNYFSLEELKDIYQKSMKDGESASFVAFYGDEIAAVRLTFAPGQWIDEKTRGLTKEEWGMAENHMAYFKSLFVSGDYQQQGLGKTLSNKSIEILKSMGAKAILCHSWLESPGNSSQRYLQRMGFSDVATHEKFWYPVDYHCTRCGPQRCVCTAIEMMKEI